MKIDWWTLCIQFINVVVLIWLLSRFFWRPVAAIIEKRRTVSQEILTDAQTKRTQAAAALVDIEQTRKGFVQERDKILADAHAAVTIMQQAYVADGKKSADALIMMAEATIEKEKNETETAWTDRASTLAIDIASRLAARLDGATLHSVFLNWLVTEIESLPQAQRQMISVNTEKLQAVTATVLTEAEQKRCRTLIGNPGIVFTVDSTLIAGLELHGPHFMIGNSWRADLDKILASLAA